MAVTYERQYNLIIDITIALRMYDYVTKPFIETDARPLCWQAQALIILAHCTENGVHLGFVKGLAFYMPLR